MVHKICAKLQNYAAHLQSVSAGGIMRSSDRLRNVFVHLGKIINVNQSRYRPGVAQRVPGSYGHQIS